MPHNQSDLQKCGKTSKSRLPEVPMIWGRLYSQVCWGGTYTNNTRMLVSCSEIVQCRFNVF